jgi:hypothetical protein
MPYSRLLIRYCSKSNEMFETVVFFKGIYFLDQDNTITSDFIMRQKTLSGGLWILIATINTSKIVEIIT